MTPMQWLVLAGPFIGGAAGILVGILIYGWRNPGLTAPHGHCLPPPPAIRRNFSARGHYDRPAPPIRSFFRAATIQELAR